MDGNVGLPPEMSQNKDKLVNTDVCTALNSHALKLVNCTKPDKGVGWKSRLSETAIRLSHRLVGLAVKASASRAEDPGFDSRLRRDFSGVESYQ